MNIEEYREHCIGKPVVTEGFPFDLNTLVFKVMGKVFALTNVEEFKSINLKCEPKFALELREEYEGIKENENPKRVRDFNKTFTECSNAVKE